MTTTNPLTPPPPSMTAVKDSTGFEKRLFKTFFLNFKLNPLCNTDLTHNKPVALCTDSEQYHYDGCTETARLHDQQKGANFTVHCKIK